MPRSRTNPPPAGDLLVPLDRAGGPALHRQVEAAIRDGIRAGRLRVGTALPPSRQLAAELGVSRGVVVEAYEQLVAEGYLQAGSGGYTQVAAGPARTGSAAAPAAPAAPTRAVPLAIDFGYGRADTANFPRAAWLRSMRRVLTETPHDRFGYPAGHGALELRTALADYLNRVRGTAAQAEDVVVVNGFAQGIALVGQVLAARGARRLAIEDPSPDDDARLVAARHGLELVGVPVDDDGVRVEVLERSGADAVVLTPSHQWPTGGVLPAEARVAVLRWARATGALVVEDDYDAEYRYDRAPIGAMQGLDADHVVYAGSASKTLMPGLRLGWLVAPRHLVADLAAAKVVADRGSPVLDQLAFADFLGRGEFDRHLRRMRPVYRARRDALLHALAERTPDLVPAGVSAGLHLVAWLPPYVDEAELVQAAARRGLGVYGVTPYRFAAEGPGGLIFGYATLSERTVVDGVALLAEALTGLRPAVEKGTRAQPR